MAQNVYRLLAPQWPFTLISRTGPLECVERRVSNNKHSYKESELRNETINNSKLPCSRCRENKWWQFRRAFCLSFSERFSFCACSIWQRWFLSAGTAYQYFWSVVSSLAFIVNIGRVLCSCFQLRWRIYTHILCDTPYSQWKLLNLFNK